MRMRGETDLVIGVPVFNRASAPHGARSACSPAPCRCVCASRDATSRIAAPAGAQLRRDFRHQRARSTRLSASWVCRGRAAGACSMSCLSFEPNDYDIALGGAAVQAFGHVGGYEFNPLAVYVREYNAGRPVAIDFAFNPAYSIAPKSPICNSVLRCCSIAIWPIPIPSRRRRYCHAEERARLVGVWRDRRAGR